MKKIILCILILSTILLAQGPGQATNPNPPDSSKDIWWFFKVLTWTNPPTAISNKLLVGIHPEYLTELHSGSLIDSFQLPSPLETRKTYYWRVDEIDSTGISKGDTWLFTTKEALIPVFIDSFSTGLNNWTAYNEADSCGWEIKNLEDSYYDLPPTAETYGIYTDNYLCGNNRTVSILELTNPPDLTGYTRVVVGWDHDLKLIGSTDSAYVEMSNDGGNSWTKIWERAGRSQRKSQEAIFLGFNWEWEIVIRFTSSLVNPQSWWAIDNFYLDASDLAFFPLIPPSDLTYNLNVGDSLNVLLSWQAGGGIPSFDKYRIQRKLGDSLDQFAYFTIGETDLNTLSFLDNSVGENIEYSYRVGIAEGPLQGLNSFPITLITAPIPVELISFTLEQLNNSVIIKWSTATELNNSGFELFRNEKLLSFIEGNGTTTEQQSYEYIDRPLEVGVYKYNLYQIDYDGTKNKIATQNIKFSIEPLAYILKQNYPNPFNPSTTIKYSIKINGLVILKVYSILGKEVAALINEDQEVGNYSVKFTASNLPSGIYFYRLKSGSFSSTKKLILLK